MTTSKNARILVRQTQPQDFAQMIALCQQVYPDVPAYSLEQLAKHRDIFPQGQLVAVDQQTGQVLGFAMSLIVRWDDYDMQTNWSTMTNRGWFTNHDPTGMTLYGAEVMVHPQAQGQGVGKLLYAARRTLCSELGLKRIRAGARLRGYGKFAHLMSPQAYVRQVVEGHIGDPTLSFQLRQRFRVIAVVADYTSQDPESRGHAAVIEWINHSVAKRSDWRRRDLHWQPPRRRRTPG